MYNKAIIRFGFCDIPNNQGLGFKVLSASTFGSADNMHLPRPWVYRILQKKEKKHTNSIARFQARASSPAVSFACLKLHHAAKEKKYKYVRSLNVMSRSITRTTVVLKETLLAWFQMQIRVKKNGDVNRANIFCRKNLKAEESVTFQNIFGTFVM